MKIIWSPLAIEKISEIAQYIALDNHSASVEWVEDVFEKVKRLKTSPRIGRVVPEIGEENIRELIFGNYRIIYRLDKKSIAVLTVRHGKQLLPVDEIGT